MKVVIPDGEFVVSFNTHYDEYELGNSDKDSVNFVGDDIDALIKEVLDDSAKDYPIVWVPNTNGDENFIGRFDSVKDGWTVALMLRMDVF